MEMDGNVDGDGVADEEGGTGYEDKDMRI